MPLCECAERARCQWDWCSEPASFSVMQPPWGKRNARAKFMCVDHSEMYWSAMTTPIKGIDRPDYADDEWRGSLQECIRHAEIAMAFEERNRKP